MRTNTDKRTIAFNFDSLTDIVSNNVGILIIFTVVIALISIKNNQLFNQIQSSKHQRYQVVKIPWRFYSDKKSLIVICDGNRIFPVDEQEIFKALLQNKDPESVRQTLEMDGYIVEFELFSDEPEYSITLRPLKLQGETLSEAFGTASRTNFFLEHYSSDQFYIFCFVRQDSFETFIKFKNWLQEKKYDVGWTPVEHDAPISYYFTRGNSIVNALLPQ